MERRLSAAQRESILLDEAKEEKIFRKELTDALKSSTQSFATALESMSKSMTEIGTVFAKSMEMVAKVSSESSNSQHTVPNVNFPQPNPYIYQQHQYHLGESSPGSSNYFSNLVHKDN
eukprot:gene8481-9385_t